MEYRRPAPYGTRYAEALDSRGRPILVLLPSSAPDTHARAGLRLGPPHLDSLGLPPDIEDRLHRQLFERGIITAADVDERLSEVQAALIQAFRVTAQDIQRLFHAGE
jgi:hypothetical protein